MTGSGLSSIRMPIIQAFGYRSSALICCSCWRPSGVRPRRSQRVGGWFERFVVAWIFFFARKGRFVGQHRPFRLVDY
ncbi:hypothetical protein BpHYR1_000113 [Brachionus plicatilis]|uniref:Uncharacterized protein n=1 Tax=Brachionus plicatilis TaxID=10195 RepID=A0A3M7QMN6_BRAPC|nr:hypothetical protein BpHYR1_000113 [Brachionus plicatilis]